MTKEDQKATISALLEEQRGYELRKQVGAEQAKEEDPVAAAAGKALVADMDERLAAISSQLRALGHGASKRSDKAEKRPAAKGQAKR